MEFSNNQGGSGVGRVSEGHFPLQFQWLRNHFYTLIFFMYKRVPNGDNGGNNSNKAAGQEKAMEIIWLFWGSKRVWYGGMVIGLLEKSIFWGL